MRNAFIEEYGGIILIRWKIAGICINKAELYEASMVIIS